MIERALILKGSQVLEVIGELSCVEQSYPICTNSKEIKKGDCFIGIKGERTDGFQYLEKKHDAAIVVYEKNEINEQHYQEIKNPNTCYIKVKDSVKYVQELAKLHCKWWRELNPKNKLIAISGSNGKTTTKEMLAHILNSVIPGKVIWTQKNDNNHLGVPFTLFKISRNTLVAVVEYGSNHPGEMEALLDISFPNMGITTNIGETHMEFFSDLEAVFKEEALIYSKVTSEKNHFFLINNDDSYLKNLKGSQRFGLNGEVAFHYNFRRDQAQMEINKGEYKVFNSNILGVHNFINLTNAFILALQVFENKKDELLEAAKSFTPSLNRSQWVSFKEKMVFLDAYNANPSSMRLAISEFMEVDGPKKLLILGDMNELGENSKKYHVELGEYVAKFQNIKVIFIGRFRSFFEDGLGRQPDLVGESVRSIENEVVELIKQQDITLIKASRSLQLESILAIK
jgi:UDP-N-acetylmuramoyl-tripeptide--D-alanyl-D-alanine ligase